MKHAARGEFHAVEFKPLAFEILCTHDRAKVSFDWREDSGKRQATFFTVLRSLNAQHLGVNKDYALFRILSTGTVHHKKPLGNSDLHGGQADARRLVHGLKHIAD